MAIEASRSTLPDSSFSTISSSSARAVSKFILAISAAASSIAFIPLFHGNLDALKVARSAHQGLHMNAHRRAERGQVITAFKHRHNAPPSMLIGCFHDV